MISFLHSVVVLYSAKTRVIVQKLNLKKDIFANNDITAERHPAITNYKWTALEIIKNKPETRQNVD